MYMPAEEKERGRPEVKTQEAFMMRTGLATYSFSKTGYNAQCLQRKMYPCRYNQALRTSPVEDQSVNIVMLHKAQYKKCLLLNSGF